jgi:hypothetical protein
MKSEQDMAGLKANSWQNAFYVMSRPLMVKMSGRIRQRPLRLGWQRVQRSFGKLRRSCLFAVKAKLKQRVLFAELARRSQKPSETEFVAVGVN